MSRANRQFSAVRTEGGLLPQDLLARIQGGDSDLAGTKAEAYHLGPRERIGEAANRSWSRLVAIWHSFRGALDKEPDTSLATGLTRDRWLLPLFQELGYGRLPKGTAIEVEGKSYAVSHTWHHSPVHLLGCRVDLDRRQKGVAGAAKSSPHGLVQEFLNRSDDHLWGFVTNGYRLRVLRDHHSLTRQAYVEFDVQTIMDGEQYSEFLLLWLVCHQSRVEADKLKECWLEKWLNTSREEGVRALDRLRDGVEKAIESFGTGFLAHRANKQLLDALESGELDKQEYYRQILRLVYRLIFLFVAEERDALLDPNASEEARERYRRYYATRRLRDLADKRRGGPHGDLWRGLALVMEKLDDGYPALALPALGSRLWGPAACPLLMEAECANEQVLTAIRHLSHIQEGKTRYPVNWRNVGADELGSVYESLLERHPRIHKEAVTFELETAAGHERRTTGSYYTPTSLVDCLLDSALDPVLDEACKKSDPEAAVLELKVCDPACGSGHFLVAAARRIAKRLASTRSGDDEPSPRDVQKALRDVTGYCIYGVDLNPMAVELCKVSLWMEAIEPGKPLSFLDSHIQCGNALLGATPALMSRGIPDDAFKPIEGDDKDVAMRLKKRNRDERKGQATLFGLFAAESGADYNTVATQTDSVEKAADDSITAVREKERRWDQLSRSPEFKDACFRADAWCAAFVWPKQPGEMENSAITHDTWRRIVKDVSSARQVTRRTVLELAREYRPLHWHLAFPQVFGEVKTTFEEVDATGWTGGFDAVLGNPPWERIQVEEKEFFAIHAPSIANLTGRDRKRAISSLVDADFDIARSWYRHKRTSEAIDRFVKASGRFPGSGRGKLTTQACLTELISLLQNRSGNAGIVVPLGVVTDKASGALFFDLISRGRLISLVGFENEEFVFTAVHHSYKFCLMTISGSDTPGRPMKAKFFCRSVNEASDKQFLSISAEDVRRLNPDSKTCPVFREARFFDVASRVYASWPSIEGTTNGGPWSLRIHRLFNASDDVHDFATVQPSRDHGRRLRLDGVEMWPVFESKMFHQFDHRFGTYVGQTPAQSRQSKLPELDDDTHEDPHHLNQPRHWVAASLAEEKLGKHTQSPWLLAVRDITSAVVCRTAIGCVLPRVASVNTLWHLSFADMIDASLVACFLAVFNSMLFDFLSRQKVTGMHLSPYIIAQLPCPPPGSFLQPAPWGGARLDRWFTDRVGELTCTSTDLIPFSQSCDLPRSCYRWDPFRRRTIRAEMDAGVLCLAGLSSEQSSGVLDTFRVLRDDDVKEFGEYRTKLQILEIYDAMQHAIDTGEPYQTLLDPPPADPTVAHPESTRLEWAKEKP